MDAQTKTTPTATHWGNYLVRTRGNEVVSVDGYAADENPSAIRHSLKATHHGCRIAGPAVRQGYLEDPSGRSGTGRCQEPFVSVSWERALQLAADALARTRDQHGNEAIYGGSYGWSSAGRFHHAQSQIHRFLACFGGYTKSVDTYSLGAGRVILPRILGTQAIRAGVQAPTCEDIATHTKLVVAFGGIAPKNMQVNSGGLGNHHAQADLARVRAAGVRYVNVGPIRDDTSEFLQAQWWPVRPQSDVALMLALCFVLLEEGLADLAFLETYCVGAAEFCDYVTGQSDGVPKSPQWAAPKCEIAAEQIRGLAKDMAADRTLISVSWSLQRSEHGEQTWWTGLALAALLGQIGLPGGGISFGYGSVHGIGFYGRTPRPFKLASLPQPPNPVKTFIPVARIADMLLNPGQPFDYNGARYQYPEIQLVYWAGGNPFHHHQDLNKLVRAWSAPQTVIANECVWNPLARHADIVFPATMPLERSDFGGGDMDTYITPMPQALDPYGSARDDYSIFSGLAERLGITDSFTEGRSAQQWVQHLYDQTCARARKAQLELPSFEDFWSGQQIETTIEPARIEFDLEKFRRDPQAFPLRETPSGKIELFSDTIASYAYDDCVGHPKWFDKQEWLGGALAQRFPLHLISNQPATRLHSQLDFGVTSVANKIQDREPVRIHPADAAARNIEDGDIVRLFNDRGTCLAGARISEQLRAGVVELPTGAWFDPIASGEHAGMCVHGNANVLTRDEGTSKLAQGTTAHSALIQIERYVGELPAVQAFTPPQILPEHSTDD